MQSLTVFQMLMETWHGTVNTQDLVIRDQHSTSTAYQETCHQGNIRCQTMLHWANIITVSSWLLAIHGMKHITRGNSVKENSLPLDAFSRKIWITRLIQQNNLLCSALLQSQAAGGTVCTEHAIASKEAKILVSRLFHIMCWLMAYLMHTVICMLEQSNGYNSGSTGGEIY